MNNYKEKLITTEQALDLIKDGYKIATAEGQGVPRGFLSKFHTVKAKGVELWTCRLPRSFPFLEQRNGDYTVSDIFLTKATRCAEYKNVSYAPCHLSEAGNTICEGRAPDMFVLTCTPPDEKGMMSSGLSGVYVRKLIESSRMIIAETNRNMPYTYGDTEFSIHDVDYITEEHLPLNPIPRAKASEKDKVIGKLVADMIHDGDCLQVGIGSIPDALMEFLHNKKDLGVHTELIGDGLVDLIEAGVINGSKKTLNKGLIITSIIDGSQKVFDFCNRNKDLIMRDTSYTNSFEVLSQNDNQISVNTTLEVDLSGQCCSESLGSKHFSGTGGQSDTAWGAQHAKGGKSFIVLNSTANVVEDGNVKMLSKIVPQLKRGAAVSLQRNVTQYVVTEYGMVNLKGLNIRQRAEALISISHPGFREWLREEASKLGIL